MGTAYSLPDKAVDCVRVCVYVCAPCMRAWGADGRSRRERTDRLAVGTSSLGTEFLSQKEG